MIKNPEIFLGHILECIELLEQYTQDVNKTQFESDLKLQDAILRRFEIIGEATKNIPHALKKKHPKIPWKKMAGMRDVLIHQYYGVSLNDIWQVIQKDLPKLKKQIKKMISELQ